MRRCAGPLLLLLTLVACGTTSPARSGGSRDVITRQEIEASSVTSAYDLVQQLRPHFLRSRGSVRTVVYVNDVRRGDLDALRSILVSEIMEIRYISAADATTLWGTGHTGGVIQVLARH